MSAVVAVLVVAILGAAAAPRIQAQQSAPAPDSSASKNARAVGTIRSINGNTVTLTTDAGSEINVSVLPTTRLVRMEPGQTDLKSALAISFSDVQVGDRLLAGGTASEDGKSVTATTAVIMKKSDVAERQQHEREEWQKHGVGGVVKAVDAASGSITLSTDTLGAPSSLVVHTSKETIIRRYALDSIKFDDAKPGTLGQIKPGDQLRARGTKSEDGKELTAAEIVSGTFRSIVGLVVASDGGNNTISVTDLATKRLVTLKMGPESQTHQLPAMFAQRIAARLKGSAQGGPGQTGGGATHAQAGGNQPGGAAGNGSRPGGAPDFQQMLNRMPVLNVGELSKGSAVMIVATEGTPQSPSTVIILLSSVEPILAAASPAEASTILSPWNLSTGAIAGTGDTQ